MPRKLAVLSILLLAGSAAALPLRGPAPGEHLAPGSRVAVSWQECGNATEAELVLSLDGGATFPLRLTGEAAPEAGTLSFRVPNLPSPRAVVALRIGGEDREETLCGTTAAFVITPSPGTAAEPLFRVAGEFATREAAAGAGHDPLPSGLDAPVPSVRALGDEINPSDAGAVVPVLVPLAPGEHLAERAPRPAASPTGMRAAICLPKRE